MNIYAISDLHLSFANPKEMDIFGEKWESHFDKIKGDWQKKVKEGDVVLIPGDISWAMRLEEAQMDLDAIGALPGVKVMLKGNHDFWWSAPSRVRSVLPARMNILQYDCFEADEFVIGGTRGWMLPSDKNFTQRDGVVYEREKIRLRLSLDAAAACAKGRELIVMMHYPPVSQTGEPSEFSKIIDEYPVGQVVFGHIHNVPSGGQYSDILVNDTNYNLVSCDYLDFKLKKII
jgi:predicted phosphohydrolase